MLECFSKTKIKQIKQIKPFETHLVVPPSLIFAIFELIRLKRKCFATCICLYIKNAKKTIFFAKWFQQKKRCASMCKLKFTYPLFFEQTLVYLSKQWRWNKREQTRVSSSSHIQFQREMQPLVRQRQRRLLSNILL